MSVPYPLYTTNICSNSDDWNDIQNTNEANDNGRFERNNNGQAHTFDNNKTSSRLSIRTRKAKGVRVNRLR